MHKLRNLVLAAVAFVALVVPATLVVLFVGHFRASPPAVETLTAMVVAATDTPSSLPPTVVATSASSVQTATPTARPTARPTVTPSPVGEASPTATEAAQGGELVTLMVLGIGVYAGENEVESIYAIDIDPSQDTVTITTFAPSILVDVDGAQDKFKLVYRDALSSAGGDEASATDAVAQALENNFGIASDHYVMVREDSLVSMVDAIGGIDVNVPAVLGSIPAGKQHFDGDTAWQYVGYVAQPAVRSELERIERQKLVLQALQGKLGSPDVVLKISRLVRQFSAKDEMRTDLGAKDVLDLLWLLKSVPSDHVHFIVIGEGLG